MELFSFKNVAHHFRMEGETWAIPKDDVIISEDGCHIWYFTEGGCDISMTKIGRDDPRLFVKKGS